MSAWMVSNETLSNIANLIDMYRITGYNSFGYDMPDDLMRIVGSKSAEQIFEMLANMNIDALKQRYPQSYEDMIGEIRYISSADIYKPRESGLTYHYQLLKSLHCFIYQCCEGSVPDCELYQAIEKLATHLSNYIISKMPEYQTAEWK